MVDRNKNKTRQHSTQKRIHGMEIRAYQNDDGTLRLGVSGQSPDERKGLVSDIIQQVNDKLGGNSVYSEQYTINTYNVAQKRSRDEKIPALTLQLVQDAVTEVVTGAQIDFPSLPRR